MKIAYVHVLPLEYYPPATNALRLLAKEPDLEVRVWSSANNRNRQTWTSEDVSISRPRYSAPGSPLPLRVGGYANWHVRTAIDLARWRPDSIISVEPHSALAVWLYYSMFRGNARLFMHHHEYYAPADFMKPGMRVLRATHDLERGDLFSRAEWISQTNEERLFLLKETTPDLDDKVLRAWPNYPPSDWVKRVVQNRSGDTNGRLRFLYLGSASLDDTYILEIAEWIASHPSATSLHIVGDNISSEAWRKVESLGAANIVLDKCGWDYDVIPSRLGEFDVGLVLYKGNTSNFVYNVPNKAIEYLAGGLNVWYPVEMSSMRFFGANHPNLPLVETDFRTLPGQITPLLPAARAGDLTAFTAENAIAPLVATLRHKRSLAAK